MTTGVDRPLRQLWSGGVAGVRSDGELLASCVSRSDDRGFEALLERHGPMVLAVCRRVLGETPEAQDAFQATFLELLRRAGTLQTNVDGSLAPWLYAVARRSAKRLAARRRGVPLDSIAAPMAVESESPEAQTDRLDRLRVLDEELDRLPSKYRDPIVLCHLQGYTQERAASLLGWPRGTLGVRLNRARDLLRQRLTRRGLGGAEVLLGTSAVAGEASAMSMATVPTALMAQTLVAARSIAVGASLVSMVPSLSGFSLSSTISGASLTMNPLLIKTILAVAGVATIGGVSAWTIGGANATQEPGSGVAPAQVAVTGGKEGPESTQIPTISQEQMSEWIDQFKVLGLAIHNIIASGVHGPAYPPAAISSENGELLLSWRVAVLPYIGQKALYDRFHLDEPWDSPHNIGLLDEMPEVYARPWVGEDQTETVIQAVFGEDAAFSMFEPHRMDGFLDGTSNTIMLVQASDPVPWTKPVDQLFIFPKSRPSLVPTESNGGFPPVVGFADGSVRGFPADLPDAVLDALITRAGGEVISPDTYIGKMIGMPSYGGGGMMGGGGAIVMGAEVALGGRSAMTGTPMGLARPAAGSGSGPTDESMNAFIDQFKEVLLALHNMEASGLFGGASPGLPPAAITGPDGRPLLSWRVAALPFLGHQPLYDRFRLDEPWDSPHNIGLLDEMPEVYTRPWSGEGQTTTVIQAVVGDGAALAMTKPRRFAEFRDGMSNTILLVQASEPVPWTEPSDQPFVPGKARPRTVSTKANGGFPPVMGIADGSVKRFDPDVSQDVLDAYYTRDGKEIVSGDPAFRTRVQPKPPVDHGAVEFEDLDDEPRIDVQPGIPNRMIQLEARMDRIEAKLDQVLEALGRLARPK